MEPSTAFAATISFIDVLLENLALPIWYKDEQGRILGCNSALVSFLGINKDKLVNHTVFDIFSSDIATALDSFDQQILSQGVSNSFETALPHADETMHEVILFLAPFFHRDGIVGGISANLVDMTERRRKERQSNTLLKSHNKLLSVIGHDLRAPLAKIQQLLSIYVGNRSMFAAEEWERIFQDLQRSTDSAKDLLDNVFMWSLSAQGTLQPVLTHFDLELLIREVLNLFVSMAASKGLAIEAEFSLQNPVFSDQNMVEVIVRNLISNAVKFSKKGGVVRIKAYENHEGDLIISVHDNGIGLEKAQLETVFLARLGNRTIGTDNEKGTGFGLNLCLELATLLGGSLRAESVVGEGSTFTFTLPVNEL